MLAKVVTCALVGLDGAIVQVDISAGLPSIIIVGLGDTAVQEARERVRAAIKNSGYFFPGTRLTVNLAPADLRKEGPGYDLPIAVGLLAASGQIPPPEPDTLFVGELSLDGATRHTDGILPIVSNARDNGFETVVVPAADAREASLLDEMTVIGAPDLPALVRHLQGVEPIPRAGHTSPDEVEAPAYTTDFSEIKGQEHVSRVGGGRHRPPPPQQTGRAPFSASGFPKSCRSEPVVYSV